MKPVYSGHRYNEISIQRNISREYYGDKRGYQIGYVEQRYSKNHSKALAKRTRKSTQAVFDLRFVWPPNCVDFGRAQIRTQVD